LGFKDVSCFGGGSIERVGKLWEGASGEDLRIKDILLKGMVGGFGGGSIERVGKLWEGASGEDLRIKDILLKGMVGGLTKGLPTVVRDDSDGTYGTVLHGKDPTGI